MKIKNLIKTIIKKCDLFSQQVTFRYDEEPAYETITGGCISIILIITFFGIFSTTLFKTLNKEFINFNLSRKDEPSPSYFTSNLDKSFLFAIGVDQIDLNSGNRYFDVSLEFRHYHDNIKDKVKVELTPCQKSQWDERGYGYVYEKLNFSKWLCPRDDFSMELEGKFSSDHFKFYKISLKKCNEELDPSRPCVNETVIESYLDENEDFRFNFYFINTIINPGDEQYLKNYLEDVNYFPFSTTNGVSANLFISSYKIETDESLWPNENVETDEGGIVLDSSQMMNYQVRGKEYLKFYLRKSPISLSIQRSFRKIDDTFSYIGGLFSTILFAFSFVSLYNELSYEISITKSSYYFDKNDPFDGNDLNLISFTGYMIFSFFEKFGIVFPWKRFERLHRFLEEGRKQIDMRLIMKKIIYAEKLGLAVLDKNKHKALLLSEPFTLEEADEIRKDLDFYKCFRGRFFPNGETLEQNEELYNMDLTILKNHRRESSLSATNEDPHKFLFPSFEVLELGSSERIDLDKEKKKTNNENEDFKEYDEFYQLDIQMRECLLELQNEVYENDDLAKKIMDKIDPRIKRRYLGKKRSLKPLKLNMKKKSQRNSFKEF